MMQRFIVLLLVVALQLSATVNSGVQWDVRSTGSDTNGGGYDATVTSPGSDFSQQDAAQVSYTDLVIGATTTQATSAAFPFGSTHPGNVVNVISGTGCTVGRHEVLSVSGTTATFSESLGTAGSTCTAKLGGSLLTLPPAVQYAANLNTVNLKFASYSYTVQQVLSPTLGGATVYITGYTTTHGDGAPSRPTITTATNSLDLVAFSTTRSTWTLNWSNINISSTATTPGICLANVSGVNAAAFISNTLISGCLQGINFGGVSHGSYWQVNLVSLYNIEVKNCTSHGVALWVSNTYPNLVASNNIHNNGGAGFFIAGSGDGTDFTRNLITNNGATGINTSTAATGLNLSQNTISNNTGDGVFVPSSTTIPTTLDNNVFYGNTGWGFDAAGSILLTVNRKNAYGSNTSGNRNNITASTSDISLTANPFVSSTDFTPNSTSGGGTLLKGASSVSNLDIGAIQSGCAVASSNFACGFSQLFSPRY